MRDRTNRAFTLVELVMSMAILGILMAGLGSAILIATKALPDEDGIAEEVLEGALAVGQLSEDLSAAIWFQERTASAATFTVSDRDADGVPERIRYYWSGTPGDPLTRQYNGGTAAEIATDVREFNLSYDLSAESETYPGPPVESAETLLSSYTSEATADDFAIKEEEWIGQYFAPSLPADATEWKVTRVKFKARKHGGNNGVTAVQLRPPAAGQNTPGGTVLEEYLMPESGLSALYVWQEFAFNAVSGLPPGTGLCLTLVSSVEDVDLCDIRVGTGNGYGEMETTDSGSSWSFFNTDSMLHSFYGTYMAPGPDQTATRQYVNAVPVVLRSGDDVAARVRTTVPALNRPELLSGLWELDFNSNPTLDLNGDGSADWVLPGGAPFDTGYLVLERWQANSSLMSNPGHDFTQLTTVDLVVRRTTPGAQGGIFIINADSFGGQCATLTVSLGLELDGTQSIQLWHNTGILTSVSLTNVVGLSGDFVHLRLLIDPSLDTVALFADDVHKGTFTYARYVPSSSNRYATLYSVAADVEYDSVSIRVGE